MGWFESLFKKKDTTEKNGFNNEQSHSTNSIVQIEDDWEVLPEFVEVDSADYPLVSAIATSIAANDRPKSQFVIKRILQRNEEVKTVSIIAASIAATDPTNNQLVVRSIARKKGK